MQQIIHVTKCIVLHDTQNKGQSYLKNTFWGVGGEAWKIILKDNSFFAGFFFLFLIEFRQHENWKVWGFPPYLLLGKERGDIWNITAEIVPTERIYMCP